MALVDAIESLSTDLEVVPRNSWISSVLEQNGEQFSIASHLESKYLAARAVTQTSSELNLFLSQIEHHNGPYRISPPRSSKVSQG